MKFIQFYYTFIEKCSEEERRNQKNSEGLWDNII